MKNLPKRYVSEDAVKRALKIDSFRNLSKDKVMQFASMIPYMDKEVAIAIINQFPVYADFGKIAIERYTEVCNSILEKNKESQASVVKGYQTILDALAKRMEKEEISDIPAAFLQTVPSMPLFILQKRSRDCTIWVT